MKSRVLKGVIVLALISVLIVANFIFVGNRLISYALDNISTETNSKNVEFSAYFMDGEKATENIDIDMASESAKMYLKIAIKGEGYMSNGNITLEGNNFNYTVSENSYVKKVDTKTNSIALNQIDAGKEVTLELNLKPNKQESFNLDLLNSKTKVSMTGTYVSEKGETSITADKTARQLQLNWISSSDKNLIENNIEVVTNKVAQINGEEKRVIQVAVTLGLKNNEYPIKSIQAELNIPSLSGKNIENLEKNSFVKTWNNTNHEEVKTNISSGKVTSIITMTNEANENNEVNWKADGHETVILTCIYPADVQVKDEEITVKQTVITHDNTTIVSDIISTKIGTEKDAIATIENINNEKEIYKGKIYAGIDREFETTTKVDVSLENAVNSISEKELNGTDQLNIYYNQTRIYKSRLMKVIGENGQLVIKNQNGEQIITITEDTIENDSGWIVVNYPKNAVTGIQLEVTTNGQYLEKGSFDLKHTKVISDINVNEAKKATSIENQIFASYNSSLEAKIENESIQLKETETKAVLDINKTTLSTLQKNENVTITATLLSNNEKYNLFKNPTIQIVLPKDIKEIDIKSTPSILYADGELKLSNVEKKALKDGRIVIEIQLSGEQTKFVEKTASNGIDIQIIADITLDNLASSKQDKIEMNYTNVNSLNNNYSTEKVINIASRYGIFIDNTVSAFNKDGETGKSIDDSVIIGKIDANADVKEIEINRTIINNYESDVQDVEIIGSLVGKGTETIKETAVKSNFDIKLSKPIGVAAQNAKVYYTIDDKITDSTVWTQDYKNAENYKIELPEGILKSGDKVNITLDIELPKEIDYNKYSYEKLEFKYNYLGNNLSKTEATYFETGDGSSTKEEIDQATKVEEVNGIGTVGVVAISGKKALEENDEIFEGQTIRYLVAIKNTTGKDLANVKLDVNHENANVYDDNVIEGYTYVTEFNRSNMEINVGDIKAGEEKVIQYQVAAKENVKDTFGNITISADNVQKQTLKTITTKVKDGDLKLVVDDNTIKGYKFIAGNQYDFLYKVKNISNETKQNVEVEINIPDCFIVLNVKDHDLRTEKEYKIEENSDNYVKVILPTIDANETIEISIDIKVLRERTDEQFELAYIAKLDDNTYVSNEVEKEIYRENAQLDVSLTGNIAENSEIKTGDRVTYTAIIKNIGNKSTFATISNNLPSAAEITSAQYEYNGQITQVDVKNNSIDFELKEMNPEETIKLVIEAQIDENKATDKTLTDYITVTYLGNNITKTYSYILKNVAEHLPDDEENPGDIENPDDPNNPGNPSNPDDPDNPSNPDDPGENINKTNVISGNVWIDSNKNGQIDENEYGMSEVNVILRNTDTESEDILTTTDSKGKYQFTDTPSGNYIVIFECDMNVYAVTQYQKEGISEEYNSNVASKKLTINGAEKTVAVTDTINVKKDTLNINAGFIENPIFDLSLRKNISKVTIQNNAGTKVAEYENTQLAKIEIPAKQIVGTTVLVEYQFVVTNEGEISGYVNDLVDNLPEGMKFNSEINKDWYISSTDGKLHTQGLSSEIKPGENATIKLTLIKTMTNDNTGLTLNTAEIQKSSNDQALHDRDSIAGNNKTGEDDMSNAQLIISVKTGADTIVGITSIIIVLVALGIFIYIIRKREVLNNEKI